MFKSKPYNKMFLLIYFIIFISIVSDIYLYIKNYIYILFYEE